MLTFDQVVEIVRQERLYQDGTYVPNEITSSGLTRAQRDLDVAPGIAMLSGYVRKAEDAWLSSKGSNTAPLQQVAKIAAIAIRILERAGGSEVLIDAGLR